MSREEKEHESTGMTRRGFLGRLTLGVVAAAAVAVPLRNLLNSESSPDNPSDGLPKDSIYRPRDDSRGNGSLNA